MTNFLFFIGIDVSKSVIDIFYYWMGKSIYLGLFENSIKGFKKFIIELSRLNQIPSSDWFICFENTGPYSKELLYYLVDQSIACKEENPLKISRSLGMRRGKSDKVDSLDICNYAFEKCDKITATVLDDPAIIKLKTLRSRRDLLVKKRTALSVSLKEQKKGMDSVLYEELTQDNKELISHFNEHIKRDERKIKSLMKSNDQMLKNNELLTSVIGIGMVTAAYFISTTNNFKKIVNARKYACYSGVAPFPNQSGTNKGRTKVNSMANKKLKSIFSNCVAAAVIHDPQLSLYYHRKLKEGKPYGVVANAIKNKLIHRAFAVIERQTPYVKILSYV
jgi:transposase